MSTTISSLKGKRAELGLGGVFLVVGVVCAALASLPSDKWVQVLLGLLGTVLSTSAGVLISWSIANVQAAAQAAEVLRPRLETISRLLASTSTKLGNAIRGFSSEDEDTETTFALVQQCVHDLYDSQLEIQTIVGGVFNRDQIIAQYKLLASLGKAIALLQTDESVGVSDTERVEKVQEVQRVLEQLKSNFDPSIEKSVVDTEVTCPHCGQPASHRLGIFPGASGIALCDQCHNRFHIHRDGTGQVFVRPGQLSAARYLKCPGCGNLLRVQPSRGEAGSQHKICMRCHTDIEFNPQDMATISSKHAEAKPAVVAGSSGDWTCPKCNAVARTVYTNRNEGLGYGVCVCGQYMSIPLSPEGGGSSSAGR